MLELYNAAQSTCSQKVRLTLAEKGLNSSSTSSSSSRTTSQARISETESERSGADAGRRRHSVVDLSVIMEYLDEEYPETSLTPAGAKDRATMRAYSASRKSHRRGPLPVLQRRLRALSDDERRRVPKPCEIEAPAISGGCDQGLQHRQTKEREDSIRKMSPDEPARGGMSIFGQKLTLADFWCYLDDPHEDLGYEFLGIRRA
jgi:glutathione S-transferase